MTARRFLMAAMLLALPRADARAQDAGTALTAPPPPADAFAHPADDRPTMAALAPLPHFLPNGELAGYLAEALESHPALRAKEAMWRGALARIPQVRSLEDPMLSYSQVLRSARVRPEIMLSQAFPWFGTLRARGDQAAAEAEALLHDIAAERDRVVEGVKLAYFDLALAHGNLDVLRTQAEILQYTGEIVEARLALGLAAEDELLRVGIERARLDDQIAQVGQVRHALERRLNSAMGAAPGTPRPRPEPAAIPPDPPPFEALASRVAGANPMLTAYAPRLEAAGHAERLARLSGFPQIALGLEWTAMPDPPKERVARPRVQPLEMGGGGMKSAGGGMGGGPRLGNPGGEMSDNGDDEWMLSVGVTLPVWRRRVRAAVEEARLMGGALRHMRRADQFDLEADLGQAWFQLEDARRRYRLYSESLIPQAYRGFESLQSRYAAGAEGSEFLDLLESVRMLLDFQMAQLEAEKDWQSAAAMLERLAGGDARAAEGGDIAPPEGTAAE